MKPNVKTAMENLIKEARKKLPFNYSFESDCEGRCEECPFKLMEFLDIDLCHWEDNLKRGDVPSIGDVHKLGEECKEIYNLLLKKGFIENK